MPAGLEPVMSRPLKRMRPRVGVRKCVNKLKHVVFPAPFGPMSAWIVAVAHPEAHVLDGDEAPELLGEPLGLEDVGAHGVRGG